MRKLYKMWLADTGWGKYTKKQKILVIWWCVSFLAMILSAAAPTFTSFVITFIISAISFAMSGLEVARHIEIKE